MRNILFSYNALFQTIEALKFQISDYEAKMSLLDTDKLDERSDFQNDLPLLGSLVAYLSWEMEELVKEAHKT